MPYNVNCFQNLNNSEGRCDLQPQDRRTRRSKIPFRTKLWGYLDFYLNDGRNVYQLPEVYDAVVNGWLGRENLARGVADVIQRHVIGQNLLELGAGSGALTLELAERGYNIIAVDIVQEALDELIYKAHQRFDDHFSITTVCETMNQRTWRYAPSNSFDAVVTLRCNRYIVDFGGFIREVYRSLRPGGVFVFPIFGLDVPTWPLHSKRRIFQPTIPFFVKRAMREAGFQHIDEGTYLDIVSPENRLDFVPVFYRPYLLVLGKPE